jgi:hypothetical protein
MREIVNGIFYVMRAGCPWRLLGEADLVGIFAHDFDGNNVAVVTFSPAYPLSAKTRPGAVASAPS